MFPFLSFHFLCRPVHIHCCDVTMRPLFDLLVCLYIYIDQRIDISCINNQPLVVRKPSYRSVVRNVGISINRKHSQEGNGIA